jgi:hypothetical protein
METLAIFAVLVIAVAVANTVLNPRTM